MNFVQKLSQKIASKRARVGIIGMGYVGSALADIIAPVGFQVTGFVTRQEKATAINKKKQKRLRATTDISQLLKQDIIIVCVQTPIYANKDPDLRFLEKALTQIASHLQKGQLIVIESSIAPGTTRLIGLPILQKSKLNVEKDFFLAFSPER